MRIRAFAVLSALLVAACSAPSTSPDASEPVTPPEHPLLIDNFLNIAHRGGGLLAPEETMPAFQRAVEANVDVLEMDVQATSDGVLVLMHDTEVDRTTDGTGKLSELTFAEARALDAGYKFSDDGGATFPYRGTGVQIATLREVLEAYPTMLFSIELKEFGVTEDVLDLIAELGMQDQVVIASFFDAALRKARTYDSEIQTILTIEESLALVQLDEEQESLYSPPAWILQLPPSLGDLSVNAALVERADRFGMKIQVWTINEPEEMQGFLDLGVHGIMSDNPEALAGLL